MSNSGTLTSRRGGLRESSLLSVVLKCSAHLLNWSSLFVVRVLLFRSIIVEFCWDLPDRLCVMSYSFMLSFTFVASSASFSLFSMKFL